MVVLRVKFIDGTDYGLRIKEEDISQLCLDIRKENIRGIIQTEFIVILGTEYLVAASFDTIAKYELIMGVSNLDPPAEYKKYKIWRDSSHATND